MKPKKNRIFLEEVYENNKKLIDNIINFIPIISTIKDGYDFYKNPNWNTGINLGLSLGSDILGTKLIGGGIKAYRTAKNINRLNESRKGIANSMKVVNSGLARAGQAPKYSAKRIALQENFESRIKDRHPLQDAIETQLMKYSIFDVPSSTIQLQYQ